MADIDTIAHQIDDNIKRAFDKALDAAWGATKDSSGQLNAEAHVLIGVLPLIRSLSRHREKYLQARGCNV